MTTLAAYAKRFSPSFTLRPSARIEALADALVHQETLKQAAYVHMPELVTLEIDETLWTLWGEIGAGAHAEDGLPQQSPSRNAASLSEDVRAAFQAALDVATRRLLAEVPEAKSPKAALSMLAALAGLTGELGARTVLEGLHGGDTGLRVIAALALVIGSEEAKRIHAEAAGAFDHTCPRCAAAMLLVRREGDIEVRWGDTRVVVRAPTADPPRLGPTLAHALALVRFSEARSAIGAAFGTLDCLRCGYRHRLLDDAEVGSPAPRARRAEPSSQVATTLAMPPDVETQILARLQEIERSRSEDELRLAGVGRFGVTRVQQYPVLCSFKSEATLDALLNDGDACPPVPSDAPELDAFAARILAAFETTDVVDVPRLIRLHVETSEARRGSTIDGSPMILPRRRRVGFKLANELRTALEDGHRARPTS